MEESWLIKNTMFEKLRFSYILSNNVSNLGENWLIKSLVFEKLRNFSHVVSNIEERWLIKNAMFEKMSSSHIKNHCG